MLGFKSTPRAVTSSVAVPLHDIALATKAATASSTGSGNVIKLAAKEEAAEDHRILKELPKELIRKKRQQKQTEAAPSEKGYRKGQRAEA